MTAIRRNNVPLLIFLSAVYFVTISAGTIEDLFEGMTNRSVPLFDCKMHSVILLDSYCSLTGWSDGIKWRIPKTMSCPLVSTKEESKLVNITFWAEDIRKHAVRSYECFAKGLHQSKIWWTFLVYEEKNVTTEEKIDVDTCRKMVETRKAPNGHKLQRISEGFLGTNLKPKTEWQWAATKVDKVVNYYIAELTLFVNIADKSIHTTTTTKVTCDYTSGFCPTNLGYLVWDYNGEDLCSWTPVTPTKCVKTSMRITCPDINVAVTNYRQRTFCNMPIYSSDQGLMFTFDDSVDDKQTSNISRREVATFVTSQVLQRLEAIEKDLQYRTKSKRDVNRYPSMRQHYKKTYDRNQLTSFFSAEEVNSRLQYLSDVLTQNLSFAIQQIHGEICNVNKRTYEMLRMLASGGSASMLVGILFDDDTYKARLTGDVVNVWKCTKVTEYMMMERTGCIKEWPVKYLVNNKTRVGFVVPLSHEIVDEHTKVACPGSPFYFDMGDDGIVLLSNTTTPVSLPTLPVLTNASEFLTLPSLSFTAPGYYSADELAGSETILELSRDLQNRFSFEAALGAMEEGIPLDKDSITILGRVHDMVARPIWKALTALFTKVGGILLFAAIVVVILIFRTPLWILCVRPCTHTYKCMSSTSMSSYRNGERRPDDSAARRIVADSGTEEIGMDEIVYRPVSVNVENPSFVSFRNGTPM